MNDSSANSKLTVKEQETLDRAVERCRQEEDPLICEIGRIYLQGLCDILRVQEKLTQEEIDVLLKRAHR